MYIYIYIYTPEVIRRKNSEEAHLFAEGRDEAVGTSTSSTSTVTHDLLIARSARPPSTLERFTSEEAVRRF